MSAPNKSYDPVAVTALSEGEVQRMLDSALAAIAAAGDLDELKAARLAHAGDRAPITLANAEIGALPPAARADAGRRMGAARAAIRTALAARQDELEAERDVRVLVEEAADVTLPWDREPAGARHPVTTVAERLFPQGVTPVGKDIRVKDVVMKIAGVFYDKSNQGRNSERVYIPQTSYQKIFAGGNRIDAIWLRPEPGTDGFELEKKVVELTKRRHDVAPDDKRGLAARLGANDGKRTSKRNNRLYRDRADGRADGRPAARRRLCIDRLRRAA